MSGTTGTNIVALVGAAAWLPHIFSWLYRLFVKPQLRFVPELTSEIGYSYAGGPIFNQTFAISTHKKDALIERLSLVIVHNNGEKHNFHWRFLGEKGFEMTSISGEKAEFSKNQTAIALKVSIVGLVEKKIFFQDFDFLANNNPLVTKLSEKENHLKKTSEGKVKEEILKSKEYQDLLDNFKAGFYWRQGKYNVYLYAFETSFKKPHIEHFEFEISKMQSEQLEKNIDIIKEEIKTIILYKEKPTKDWPHRPPLNWVNTSFRRAQNNRLKK